MEVINKIILGIVQGITGIVPVSSTGHLIILNDVFGMEVDLAFLTFLHLTTGLAIIWGFWDEIKYVFLSEKRNYLFKILALGTIPAMLAGIIVHDYLESVLHNVAIIIPSLIFFGILMIYVDNVFGDKAKTGKLEDITMKKSLIIGLSQMIALIPGTSRAGITIMSAMTTGVKRKVALAFSFLIGLPVIMGSFFAEILKDTSSLEVVLKDENLIGGLAAFIFSYFTILVIKKLASTKFLTFFGVYRIALAVLIAIIVAI